MCHSFSKTCNCSADGVGTRVAVGEGVGVGVRVGVGVKVGVDVTVGDGVGLAGGDKPCLERNSGVVGVGWTNVATAWQARETNNIGINQNRRGRIRVSESTNRRISKLAKEQVEESANQRVNESANQQISKLAKEQIWH
jgi:hypothetical protein